MRNKSINRKIPLLLPTRVLLQLRFNFSGQVKYTVIYGGYCVTVFMLLLASLDFGEMRNMKLTPFTAVLLLPGQTLAAYCRLFRIVWSAENSSICRESGKVVPVPPFFLHCSQSLSSLYSGTTVMDHTDHWYFIKPHSFTVLQHFY